MSKRRLIEWGKNLLILLLSVSAIWLMTMTPLVQDSGLADLFSGKKGDEEPRDEVVLTAAAHPSRMAVVGESGRYGVQYDQSAVDEMFARMGPLLGEALNSAGEPVELTQSDWQHGLSLPGIYFDFDRSIPLSALGSWLQQEGKCALTGTARRIVLTAGGEDEVRLYYQDGGSGAFYSCVTGLSFELHLEPAVASVTGNDALFAFEREDLELLQPYTLITEIRESAVYTVSNPLADSGEVTAILKQLSFGSDSHVPISGGEAYLDGGARLEITDGGSVYFSDGQREKYPVAALDEAATVAEMIEAAREIAEQTVGSRCGQARLYLESVRETEEGVLVRFGYRLNGSAVWLYEGGWAAEFLISDGCIGDFTLHFRAYTATGGTKLLLPMDQAAVILPGVTDVARELAIQYRDGGGTEVSPGWVAE